MVLEGRRRRRRGRDVSARGSRDQRLDALGRIPCSLPAMARRDARESTPRARVSTEIRPASIGYRPSLSSSPRWDIFSTDSSGGARTSATVASTSRVSEVVIVWRTMGWSEPILTLPMVTVLRVGIGRRRRGQHGNPARESRKGNNGSHRFAPVEAGGRISPRAAPGRGDDASKHAPGLPADGLGVVHAVETVGEEGVGGDRRRDALDLGLGARRADHGHRPGGFEGLLPALAKRGGRGGAELVGGAEGGGHLSYSWSWGRARWRCASARVPGAVGAEPTRSARVGASPIASHTHQLPRARAHHCFALIDLIKPESTNHVAAAF